MRYSQHWTKIIPRHPGLSNAMRSNPVFAVALADLAALQ
jgi:hypothetical protein